jgi:hypothetical protein
MKATLRSVKNDIMYMQGAVCNKYLEFELS